MNSYLSGLLSNVLSKYIEEIQPGELNISLFAGQNVLKNLTLKKDALTSLKLPFTIIKGTVGNISINCSVCSMLFYPFTLEISDVYILASVNSSVMYEQTEACIGKMVIKKESSKIVNYITGKALNIAASVKYVIKNIHIKIDHAFPEGYVAAGFFIPSIEIFTIDSNDNQVNQRIDLQHVQKKIVFNDLSLYLDNYKDAPPQINFDNFQAEMQNLITDEGHNFIFKNKSLEGKFINNVQTQENNKFEINLEEILLNLSQTQYRSALLFMREFHKFNIRKYFAANGRPSTFPQEENVNTSGYWWLYSTHSAVLMNYRNNFKPDFALDFLKRRKECIESIRSQNYSKDSINQATEKYGQNFMRSIYKYAKFFKRLPSLEKRDQASSTSSGLVMSGNLGIKKLQVKLYDEQMESMLILNKNDFALAFKSFESANLKVSIDNIDFVTNEQSYLKVGTPELPAVSSVITTGLNEINVELSVQDPNVVFEEKLALYFKDFFDVRVETVKNLFKLEPKKSKKKVDENAAQRAINAKADLNNLKITSHTNINDISFGVNLINVKLIGGIIEGNLSGLFALVNQFDILKDGNIDLKFNNNHLDVIVQQLPLTIDYIEIDDIVNHAKSILNVVLGLTSKDDSKVEEITDESNNNNQIEVPQEAPAQAQEKSSTPFTLNCDLKSFTFAFLHNRQETFDLSVSNIIVSRGEDLAFLVNSDKLIINQMIVRRNQFVELSGFKVKFDGSLNVDLNDVNLNLSPKPLNYLLTAIGLFNDKVEEAQANAGNIQLKDQSGSTDSLTGSETFDHEEDNDDNDDNDNNDNNDDDEDDEDKKLEQMIYQDKLNKLKVISTDEQDATKEFKFQSGTVVGIKRKKKEEEKKKDSKPFLINVNINKGKIALGNRKYDFGTCCFEKATVPLSIGGPGLKFELYLDEVDFKSVQLEHFKDFLQTPKLHFGFYDQTIFLDSPSLEMDFQFQYLMTFISFASSLYHVYEEYDPKRKEREEQQKKDNDTGLHLPDLKYKINLETIKLKAITRYIQKANHYLYIVLSSFTMDSDVRSEMNFASKKLKLLTKDNETMISIKEMKLPIEYIFDEDLMVKKINVKPNFKSIKYEHDLAEELVILDFLASFISENTTIPQREFRRLRGRGRGGRGRGRGGRGRGGRGRRNKQLTFKTTASDNETAPVPSSGPKKDTSFELVIDVKSDVVQVVSRSYKETNIFLEGFGYYQDSKKKAIRVHRLYINIARHQKVEEVKTDDQKALKDESKSSKSKSKSSSKSSKSSSKSSSSKSRPKIYLDILRFNNPDNEDDVAFELANNSLIMNLKNITLQYEYKVIVQLLCIYQETRFIRYNFTDPKPIIKDESKTEEENQEGGLLIKVGVSNVSIFFPVDEYKLGLKVDDLVFSSSKAEGMAVVLGPLSSFFENNEYANILYCKQLTYKSFSKEENKNVLQVITEPLNIVVDPAVIVSGILILEKVTESFKKLHISNDNFKPDTEEEVVETKTVYDFRLKDIVIKINKGNSNVKALQDTMTLMILRIPENQLDLEDKRIFKFGSLEYINPNTSSPDLVIEPFEVDIRMNLQDTFYLDLSTIRVNIAFSTVQKMIHLLQDIVDKIAKKSIKQDPPQLVLVNDTSRELKISVGEKKNEYSVPRYDKKPVSMDKLTDDFSLYLHIPNSDAVVFHKSELFYPNFIQTDTDKISVSWKRTSKGQKIRFSPVTVVINNTEFYIQFSSKSGVKDPKDLFQAQRFRTTEFLAPVKSNKDYVLSIGGMGYSKQSFSIKDIKQNPVTVNCKWNDNDQVGIVVFAYLDPETFVLEIELNYSVTIINKLSYPINVSILNQIFSAEVGEEVGCSVLDTGDTKCNIGVAINGQSFLTTNNEISLKDKATSEIQVIGDSSQASISIAASIDRSYNKNPLRIILYPPVVFFNETGLDIGISDMRGDKVRYFPESDKMLMAGNKYFFPENVEESGQQEEHSFKIYYQTDRIGAFEINPNTLNIDQNLLIPLNGSNDFVHYADKNMTYYAGNAFEAGNDMSGEQSIYLPLHFNVRSNQPDSRTLIVTLFCQVLVLNELKFDIFLQPVINNEPFGEKIKISAKSKQPVPLIASSSTYQFHVTTSDPSQKPVLISLERSCHTNFFLKRPISSKKSKQEIIVNVPDQSSIGKDYKLDYVSLKTEVISTDFIATFSRGTFAESPFIILNQLSSPITYTQKRDKEYVNPEVLANTSSILAFTQPFDPNSHVVYIDIDKLQVTVDLEEPKEQEFDQPDSDGKKKLYVSSVKVKGRSIILVKNKPYCPVPNPIQQYYLTMSGFELSLINSRSRESMLLTLGQIIVQYRTNPQTKVKTFDAAISSLRVDNLSEKAIWPVVIYSGKTPEKPFFIKFTVDMPSDEARSSDIDNLSISIQPILVAVDTSLLEVLLEFFKLLSSESKKSGIFKPLSSSTSRNLMPESETTIKNYDISNIDVFINFSKNSKVNLKEFFINLIPNIKDFEAKFRSMSDQNYGMSTNDLINTVISTIKSEVLNVSTVMNAFTKISANQASSKSRLKFVSGVTVPNTRIRDAKALPMKQIIAFDKEKSSMQRQIRDRVKSDEVVEIFCNTKDDKTICLSDTYITVFKKGANDTLDIETLYNYKQITPDSVEAIDDILRFIVKVNGNLISNRVENARQAKMAQMFIKSMINSLDIGEQNDK